MAERMRSRGPDDSGVWRDAGVALALGQRRLSIIDLSPLGHQPMISADGRFVLTYNGELYNFREVAADLVARGMRFRGGSDTEVLVEAISAWGVDETLPRLSGMFAFAVWDRMEGCLFLARDRLGIKPLYYGQAQDAFFFASELKAFDALPGFSPEIDRDALTLLLRHGYVLGPHSIFRGIRKLQPGHLLRVEARRACEPRAWWSAREAALKGLSDPFRGHPDEAVEALDALGRRLVRDHMVADVPLGAFLSGGIDSSSVVAMMQAQSARPVKTFTIGFEEDGFDEARHARMVANHLGTDHTELYLRSDDARAVIPRLPEFWDEPFADSSQIPTFLVSRLARESVTVSLSGDGGDELFGGYDRYAATLRSWRHVPRLPAGLRRMLAGALRRLPVEPLDAAGRALAPLLSSRLRRRHLGQSLHYRSHLLGAADLSELYRFAVSYWPDPERLVPGAHEPSASLTDRTLAREFPDPLERMMLLDTLTYLPDDILTKVDRASMAVGLEARVPLLDHRFYEFAWRLPLAVRVRDGVTKWVLRQVLARYVPPALFERPKMGFGVPIGEWLRGPLREWAEDLLHEGRLRNQGVFDPRPVRAAWSRFLAGAIEEHRLWIVLMFQAWLEHREASRARAQAVA